jgi:hypothetical protein
MKTLLKIICVILILFSIVPALTIPGRIKADTWSGIGFGFGILLFWYLCTVPFFGWGFKKKPKPAAKKNNI